MAASAKEITFIVPGRLQEPAAGAAAVRGRPRGRSAASVLVGAPRGNGDAVSLTARPGEDVVVLTVANGPTLVLHPEHARDLLLAQTAGVTRGRRPGPARRSERIGAAWAGPGWKQPPPRRDARLDGRGGARRHRSDHRGHQGFRGQSRDGRDHTQARRGRERGRVPACRRCVAALAQGRGLKPANMPGTRRWRPLLVLVHGTFVDTVSTFGKLWTAHPQRRTRVVRAITAGVCMRWTIRRSPKARSPTRSRWCRRCRAGARMHLVTHSRGGLVAEVLARACGGGALGAEELAFFQGAGYARSIAPSCASWSRPRRRNA